jgi:hypothetical protein
LFLKGCEWRKNGRTSEGSILRRPKLCRDSAIRREHEDKPLFDSTDIGGGKRRQAGDEGEGSGGNAEVAKELASGSHDEKRSLCYTVVPLEIYTQNDISGLILRP